jgi:hypothetical protein
VFSDLGKNLPGASGSGNRIIDDFFVKGFLTTGILAGGGGSVDGKGAEASR